uniref:RNase III domain-containing protein n=2 Tax=Panagrellus redivivus TaxID=6233 RepID=A0A7E5A070_PANRE
MPVIIEDPFYSCGSNNNSASASPTESTAPRITLDVDSLYEVFGQYVQMAPISQAVMLRSLNWQVCRAINYALFKTTNLSIAIKYHANRIANPEPYIVIQDSAIRTIDKALECIDFILSHARIITTLDINIEVCNANKYLTQILEKFSSAQHNVQLEVLKIRRRYVGESYPIIADLIYDHAETLREVGRIGLNEAVEGFCDKLHLERLSLMNFDLIDDGDMESVMLQEKTRYCLRRLADSGATFEHLSYTTFTGFELNRHPALRLLKNGNVKSLKLTMQKGTPLQYGSERVLHEGLERLEFVGDMVVHTEFLGRQFPNLNYFDFDRQDLACGMA